MDKVTIDRIKQAHPVIREQLLKDYIEANNLLGKGVRLRFAYVYRSPQEQDKLFKQKPKVTNAKAWQSIHNYGLAFDIVIMYDNNGDNVFEEVSWNMLRDGDKDGKADWKEIIDYFQKKGYEWGGTWKKFKDYPHFQKSFGFTWQQLKAKYDNKETFVENGITYVKL
jgi:peptidoglycan LD-endopeptidase CwlK